MQEFTGAQRRRSLLCERGQAREMVFELSPKTFARKTKQNKSLHAYNAARSVTWRQDRSEYIQRMIDGRAASEMHTGEGTAGMWAMETQKDSFMASLSC